MGSKIVTIISDFGMKDHCSSVLKGKVISKSPDVQFVDITNEITPFDIVGAAFMISNAYQHFPEGTIHILAVHLYGESHNELLCFNRNGHIFIGPNNGIFSLIFNDIQNGEVYMHTYDSVRELDAFNLVAAFVQAINDNIPMHTISNKGAVIKRSLNKRPVYNAHSIRATIIHIDHFQNVILNITETDFVRIRKGRSFGIYYNPGTPITKISSHYGDVNIGEVLCLFNSMGYLEIAINLGKAASLLNLVMNETVHIDFQS